MHKFSERQLYAILILLFVVLAAVLYFACHDSNVTQQNVECAEKGGVMVRKVGSYPTFCAKEIKS